MRAATEESIVGGFVLLAWTGVAVSLAAVGAAMLVRHKNAEESIPAATVPLAQPAARAAG